MMEERQLGFEFRKKKKTGNQKGQGIIWSGQNETNGDDKEDELLERPTWDDGRSSGVRYENGCERV
jgi:hypothetical protein